MNAIRHILCYKNNGKEKYKVVTLTLEQRKNHIGYEAPEKLEEDLGIKLF